MLQYLSLKGSTHCFTKPSPTCWSFLLIHICHFSESKPDGLQRELFPFSILKKFCAWFLIVFKCRVMQISLKPLPRWKNQLWKAKIDRFEFVVLIKKYTHYIFFQRLELILCATQLYYSYSLRLRKIVMIEIEEKWINKKRSRDSNLKKRFLNSISFTRLPNNGILFSDFKVAMSQFVFF